MPGLPLFAAAAAAAAAAGGANMHAGYITALGTHTFSCKHACMLSNCPSPCTALSPGRRHAGHLCARAAGAADLQAPKPGGTQAGGHRWVVGGRKGKGVFNIWVYVWMGCVCDGGGTFQNWWNNKRVVTEGRSWPAACVCMLRCEWWAVLDAGECGACCQHARGAPNAALRACITLLPSIFFPCRPPPGQRVSGV